MPSSWGPQVRSQAWPQTCSSQLMAGHLGPPRRLPDPPVHTSSFGPTALSVGSAPRMLCTTSLPHSSPPTALPATGPQHCPECVLQIMHDSKAFSYCESCSESQSLQSPKTHGLWPSCAFSDHFSLSWPLPFHHITLLCWFSDAWVSSCLRPAVPTFFPPDAGVTAPPQDSRKGGGLWQAY